MSTDTIDTKALRERIDTTRKTKAGTPLRAALIQELGLDFIEHGPALLDAVDRLAALEEERDAAQAEARELREARNIWRRMAAQRLTELQHWQRGFAELAQLLPAESQVVEKPAHFSQPAAEPSTKRESLPLISEAEAMALCLEVGLCAYGEGMGAYNIPVPAFRSRITRLVNMAAQRGQEGQK